MGTANGIISKPPRAVMAATAVVGNEQIVADATSGAYTVVGPPAGTARRWGVKKSDASSNVVTISYANSGGTSVAITLTAQDDAKTFEPLGAGFVAVGVDRSRAGDDARYAPVAPQFHGARYTAFGHSFGQVQSPVNVWAGSLYPARLRDLLHVDTSLYVNRTVSGSTMAQAATVASTNWVDGNGGLVTIMANQNDVGNHIAAATFKSAFQSLLTTLLGSTGKPPTVLVIKDTTCTTAGYARYGTPPTDADVAAYNGYLDTVIATFPTGWILVADPLGDGWNPATMTGTDGQHPNDNGMAFITNSCLKVLRSAAYRPGQNPGFATPLIATAPSALTLNASAGNAQVTLSGSGGIGASSIALYRGTTATGTPIATSLPFTDTGLTNGTAVSYIATATNTQGTVTSNIAAATPTAASTLISDTFNRSDSSTTLGSTDTGAKTWTASPTGAVFGIASNTAYRPTASTAQDDHAVIDSLKADFDMSLTLATTGGTLGIGPIFRFTDDSNFWTIDCTSAAGFTLYQRVGGAFSSVQVLTAATPAAGDVLRITATGSTITVYRNGTQVGTTVTDSFNSTATKHGFRVAGGGSNTGRFDNFSVA